MRRVFTAILAAFGITLAGGASALPIVSVHTATPTVSIGGSVVVDVEIFGASDLYGFQLDLGFDPNVLSFTGGASTEGAFLPGGGTTFFIAGTDNGSGAVAGTGDTLVGPIPGVSGNGVLASFAFTAVGLGVSALTLDNVFLLDSSINPIEFAISPGSVTVEQAVPEPATVLLLGTGLAALAVRRRRRAA